MADNPMLRLYELAGYEIDRESGTVRMTAAQQVRPVEMVIKVVPSELHSESGLPVEITFDVILDSYTRFDTGSPRTHQYSQTLKLPSDQLRFLEDEKSDG
jgi:hypothetical protein